MFRKCDIGSNRLLIAVPTLILVLAIALMLNTYMSTGEWFQKSIELKGGTLVSLTTDSPLDITLIKDDLSQQFGQVVVRELRSFSGYSLTIQADTSVDTNELMSALKDMGLDTSDSSVETMGPSLGESFWTQAQISMIVAFILMGIIVFVIFRTFIPSMAVIIAAVSDIIVTLALMQVFSIELSMASFAALLMLIGYSIDTDILLTTRVMRNRENSVSERMTGAFKTGITMTLTTISVLVAVVLTTTSSVLFAIASVLLLGLFIDIINTWFMNATIIRWYAEKRGL